MICKKEQFTHGFVNCAHLNVTYMSDCTLSLPEITSREQQQHALLHSSGERGLGSNQPLLQPTVGDMSV